MQRQAQAKFQSVFNAIKWTQTWHDSKVQGQYTQEHNFQDLPCKTHKHVAHTSTHIFVEKGTMPTYYVCDQL